jgi:hypothetical protein
MPASVASPRTSLATARVPFNRFHLACYTVIRTMAISKDLLEILVCPICKATVEVKSDQSGLKCVECHRVYPIRDEIPVMLVEEAKIED